MNSKSRLSNKLILFKRTQDGFTALLWAADSSHVNIIQLLLDAGANINHQSNVDALYIYLSLCRFNATSLSLLKSNNLCCVVYWRVYFFVCDEELSPLYRRFALKKNCVGGHWHAFLKCVSERMECVDVGCFSKLCGSCGIVAQEWSQHQRQEQYCE